MTPAARRDPETWQARYYTLKPITRLVLFSATALPVTAHAIDDQASFQLELANDVVLSSDNQFTNGVAIHHHSRLADSLHDTGGTLAFGKVLAGPLLPRSGDLYYRETWVFGQSIQTPDDIETSELILNDVPYAGGLFWSNGFYAFNDERFYGFQWLLGWGGSDAHAEATQKGVHTILGGDNPRGWSNQLDSEPLLNLHYAIRQKVFNKNHVDASVTGDLALGNMLTFAQTGLEFRLGKKPPGFAYVPDPPGRGLDSDATLRADGARYIYGSATVRLTGTLHSIALDGNLLRNGNEWTEQNAIEPETWTRQLILGLHYTTPRWGAHATLWLSSESVDESNLAASEDPRNSFGSLLLEYRF
ncbi:lipid A deacylase LpxR family protein [uncultured Marinobacter sp.]|uniref:lipid A deacylase LpxR family protein n=1 Tax=uncultured Marinobacter sp. TaxID=187379 RepID=UPI0030DC66BC